jgi:alkanesulfonate monooxygenase SsuD/methylene tetrahydromethanopterin reductase-like flavin-dependent oxidoreductase (luciferase family)
MLLGAFAPASLERAARIADGIMPAAGRTTTIEKLSQTINNFRDTVRRAGRSPDAMKWILRVHNPLDEEKASEPRALLGGTPQQAARDLPRLKELGIDHVFYDMNHPAHVPIETQLVLLRRLVRLIKASLAS